jgi:hypothetical protein
MKLPVVGSSVRGFGAASHHSTTGSAANERGERLIWLDWAVVDRLRSLRGPGESFNDVILRMADR